MSSKKELAQSFERILWLEEQMKNNYASYKQYLSDEKILSILGQIEKDESRHINMAQRIITILST